MPPKRRVPPGGKKSAPKIELTPEAEEELKKVFKENNELQEEIKLLKEVNHRLQSERDAAIERVAEMLDGLQIVGEGYKRM